VAEHRSPGGRRAHRAGGPRPAHRPSPEGFPLRTNVLATAAAVGAVATGTLSTLVPAAGPAVVDRSIDAALSAATAPLDAPATAAALPALAGAMFVPVGFAAVGNGEATPVDEQLAQLDKAAGLAQQLADLHARQEREQAEQVRIAALVERGGLDAWIAEALDILDLPQSLAPAVKKIIMHESGGNPRAINNWDSNARRGTPSQGLMQTIPSTYRAYVHPEFADRPITDPVANITAGIRYMIATYGIETLEAGGRRSASGSYVGY
jgi:soluble lytic murein transglycosylase-like protein